VNELKEKEGGSDKGRRWCKAGGGTMWRRTREKGRGREERTSRGRNQGLPLWESTNHEIGADSPTTAALDCDCVVRCVW